MKRTLTGLCLWSLGMASSQAGVQSSVDSIIKRLNPNVNLGIVVYDLTSGQTLYQRNAKRLYIPASNMKMYSEAAALMVLGPDYQFENKLSTDAGQLQNGVLKGNVYLKLSGDPSFSHVELKHLFYKLKELHVHAISGSVIIDSSLAGVDPYPPGWLKSDLNYGYGAPIAPLMLDSNRLSVTVNPGAKVGDPAVVEMEDGGGDIVVNNRATTKASPKGCGVGLSLDKENHLTVSGCVGVNQWAVVQKIAIKNPVLYAEGMIRAQLKKSGIQLAGTVKTGKSPRGAMLLATEKSKPMAILMADTLKPSDNQYADSLYLHAAERLHGAPVNWQTAQPIIKNFLQEQTGIDLKNAVFTDGSGLSRYNLVTPNQTIELLKFLYQRFPMSYEYIAALPIGGRDGTLMKRFKGVKQQGFIRAKTGTMTGMNSLSGYLYTTNGHTLAFAMFINRLPGSKPTGPGRPLLDALCTYFMEQTPGSNSLARVFSPHNRVRFQQFPTQGDYQRRHQARWRQLESNVKQALRGLPVTVIYRGDELVIQDNQSDASGVWNALKGVNRKLPFAVAVFSSSPVSASGGPLLLWMQPETGAQSSQRTWVIREAQA